MTSRSTSDRRSGGRPEPPAPLALPVADSHCHLDLAEGPDDWSAVEAAVERAAAVGVPRIVQIGCDVRGSRWASAAAARHPALLAGIALHPNEVPRLAAAGQLDAALAEIEDLARSNPRVRAIGETGLDHFRTTEEGWKVQEEAFRAHIAMAKEYDRALVIHNRDAHEDVLRVLADEGAPDRVLMHCFSGDAAMARECVRRGYYLSFAGNVTFKNAQGLRDALAAVPIERLLVETDAPYLTPVPYRGRPNASYLIPLTVRCMAQVKGVDEETLCAAIAAATEEVFGSWETA